MGTIRILIVDDHQSIIDGYLYRLQGAEDIKVVGTTFYGEEIEPLLKSHDANLLLLDANIPSSASNPSTYPVFFFLPKLLEQYKSLHVVIISMFNKPSFIHFALESGVSGYILKDDYQAIESLPEILRTVVDGEMYFSEGITEPFVDGSEEKIVLTPRQLQALSLCLAYPNETTAELAHKMDIENSTMRNLLSQSYLRLGVRNRNAAVIEARRLGLIFPPYS